MVANGGNLGKSHSYPADTDTQGKVMKLNSSTETVIVSLVFIVGLIVLIALKDITSSVGLPLIVAIVGTHVGSGLTSTANSTATTTTVTKTPPIQ